MVLPYPFTRILVPTDFSTCSDAALALAGKLAHDQGAELCVLHVVEHTGLPGDAVIHPPTHPSGITVAEYTERLAAQALGSRLSFLELRPERTRTRVLHGAPGKLIPAYADEIGASLIVMGTHGRSGLAHMLAGSIAEKLVRTSLIPVMTVREPVCREQPLDPGLDGEKDG